jgi:catechol 2,3-dioxygenase-like lactoylglutathione lyase family enzyme
MIDHVSVPVADLARGAAFYQRLLGTIGLVRLADKATTIGFGKRYPEFWINLRSAMGPVPPESGAHIGLRASSPDAVQAFCAAAAGGGGSIENAPKLWTEYGTGYFAAFIRDPDGNRIEAVHFVDAGAAR